MVKGTGSTYKGSCGSEEEFGLSGDKMKHQTSYRMNVHHYMPTAMSPVALDRYEKAFADITSTSISNNNKGITISLNNKIILFFYYDYY